MVGALTLRVLKVGGQDQATIALPPYEKLLENYKRNKGTQGRRTWLKLLNKPAEMFPAEDVWLSALLGGMIGGIISVLFLNLLDNEATKREPEGPDYLNESQKHPQEHDERLC